MMTAPNRSLKFTPLLAALIAACAVPFGCAVYEAAMPEPAAKRVSIADFASGNADASRPANAPPTASPEKPADSAHEHVPLATVAESNEAGVERAADSPGQPPASSRRLRPGEVFIVDSLVGQINGRPVYADAFFAPLEDQLIQERRQLGDVAFRDRAWSIIITHLTTLVEEELFLAEAQASLRPEERQGLFAFMRYMRERTIAMGGGTQTGAQQRLQELGEGETIDEYVRGRLDEELIRKLLQEKILPRVIVSWRDVEREYRRRENEFNPPPTLHLSRIVLRNDQHEEIEKVQAALGAGESFEEVARRVGQDDVTWESYRVTYGDEGVEEIDYAREYLVGRRVGETTDPIRTASTTRWLHLAKVEQTQRSLYDLDVQRALTRHLHNERVRAEQARYMDSLLKKRVHDDLTVMARRLFEVALLRYGGSAVESPAS